MHCDPNLLDDFFINSGSSIAEVLIDTLSAPANNNSEILTLTSDYEE